MRHPSPALGLALLLLPLSLAAWTPVQPALRRPASLRQEARNKLARTPVHFERNAGQADPAATFLARGGGFHLLLNGQQTWFLNAGATEPVQLTLSGSSKPSAATPEQPLPGVSNYLYGKDPAKWRTNVRHYGRVRFHDVYPGVDLLFYSKDGQVEYDFELAPGADPSPIQLSWKGVDSIRIDEPSGDLLLTTSTGIIRHKRPVVYQQIDGQRVAVAASYRQVSDSSYRFQLAAHDARHALTIDPVLGYSTFLGGSDLDEALTIAVDLNGSTYVGGYTRSPNFPVVTPFQRTIGQQSDGFLIKFSFDGTFVLYSTYFGGDGEDRITSVAVDPDGAAYLTGLTTSFGLPTTTQAFQRDYSGQQDAFYVRLSVGGDQVLYGTYLGTGDTFEKGDNIAVDASGAAIISGTTNSPGFPTTEGAIDRTYNGGGDIFVTKFNPTGTLAFSTYMGGAFEDAPNAMVLDRGGEIYVAGGTASVDFPTTAGAYDRSLGGTADAFVFKLSQNGRRLVFSTLLGGNGVDIAYGMALEPGNRILLAGSAGAGTPGFPIAGPALRTTVGGGSDAFFARLNSDGSTLITSTLLGTNSDEFAIDVKPVDGGYVALAGLTQSNNWPTTPDAWGFSASFIGDVFFSILQPLGNAASFSTVFNGSFLDVPRELVRDPFGSFYIVGATSSGDYQVTPTSPFPTYRGGPQDGFVSKILNANTPDCTSAVTPAGTIFSTGGGAGGVGVGTGCTWFASTGASWISLSSNPLTDGAGSLNYNVATYDGAEPRTGSLQVAGNVIQILQRGTAVTSPFQDVPASDPFADFVRIIRTNAVTSGCATDRFCPNDNTTRGQMAVFVVRSMLLTDDFSFRSTPYFNDVPSTHPQFKWIQKLRELGITTGCSLITYCPDDMVTRGQMATFLVRARFGPTFRNPSTPYFTDVPSSNTFFPFVQKLRQSGVTTGCSATAYCVDAPTTRAQMAVFLTRMLLTPW